MARQVKLDCPRLPVPFTYTGNSIYHRGSAADQPSERNCRGLRTILRGGKRAGEKKKLDCTVFHEFYFA